MEFWFHYYSRSPYDISIAITVPRNAFDILYKTEQISFILDINDSPVETYVFCVKESVMYHCKDEKCQKIPVNITGLNLYFVLLWLIKQLGKEYDYIGAYTPIITENVYHPAKLAMMAVSQVISVDNPCSYSVSDVLAWSIDRV